MAAYGLAIDPGWLGHDPSDALSRCCDEVIADDTRGNGPFVFASSPELSVTTCATSTPLMCFSGPDDIYVSVSVTSGLDDFPSSQLVAAMVTSR